MSADIPGLDLHRISSIYMLVITRSFGKREQPTECSYKCLFFRHVGGLSYGVFSYLKGSKLISEAYKKKRFTEVFTISRTITSKLLRGARDGCSGGDKSWPSPRRW